MPELIEHSNLYIAQPPLYKLKTKEGERYIASDVELRRTWPNSAPSRSWSRT
jgi:DNA gyrase/topoisomerase IV subunit B